MTFKNSAADLSRQRSRRRFAHHWSLILLAALTIAGLGVASPVRAEAGSPIVGLAGKCLTGPAGGTPVELRSCDGGSDQQWTRPGDGTIQVLGQCLDVRWASTTAGAAVQLWPCNGTGAQQWTATGGTVINPNSGNCLDLTGFGIADGTPMQTWTCGDRQANQTWTFDGTRPPGGCGTSTTTSPVRWAPPGESTATAASGPVTGRWGRGTRRTSPPPAGTWS